MAAGPVLRLLLADGHLGVGLQQRYLPELGQECVSDAVHLGVVAAAGFVVFVQGRGEGVAGAVQAPLDPVCGMTVTPASAAARREVAGTTVWFCSAGCAAAYDADPERYPYPPVHHTS